MIQSREDLVYYLSEDLKANKLESWRFYYRWRYPVLHFQRRLRKTE